MQRLHRLAAGAMLCALWAGSAVPARLLPAQAPAAPDTSWVARSALYEIFVQDFSPAGNLQGVIRGLDRVEAAGADVVWLMPIHPVGVENRKGTLGSRYAVRDYLAIDSVYGTRADFRALVEAVHGRGMKVILDWVPDHTSWDNVWVTAHPEYYLHDEQGGLVVPRDPQGNPTDWTDVVQLDFGNAGLRKAMIDAMRYWLVEFGIDGFRVDVAGFIPYDFWREAIPALRASVPRRLLFLAEWGDIEMNRAGYDLTYAWDSYSRLKAVWRGAPAASFVEGELPDMRAMPPGGMRLRFTTNHDETAWDAPPVTIFGGAAGARAAFVAMVLLPGRPLLYNGQEVESPQKLGLFEREPIVWDQPGAAVARSFYRNVIRIVRSEPALLTGDLEPVTTSAPADVIAYRRGDVLVLVNARPREVKVAVPGLRLDGSRDLLSNETQHGDSVVLPPYGTAVLRIGGGN
ncbi:MAG: alpha-amylase family glycosyl hydrolase [Gemmatimonadales bacterium]